MNEAGATARFALHLDAADGGHSAVELVAAHCDLSRTRIKAAMSRGAAWLEDPHGIRRLRRAGKLLCAGDRLHFYHDPRVLDARPAPAVAVADEGDYSIWNKPAGMLSQGSKWGDHCAIGRWVETHADPPRPCWPVHRLDRETRGLILLAHRRASAAALAALFEQREVSKHYLAIVEGHLGLAAASPIDLAIDGRPARSLVRRCRYDPASDTTAVEIEILTGRKHQVRRHLQALGHPLVGDRRYGGSRLERDLQLTAFRLAFRCPITGLARDYRIDSAAAGDSS